jgi:hypothetical protein
MAFLVKAIVVFFIIVEAVAAVFPISQSSGSIVPRQ